MAGDWVKIRKCLQDDGRMLQLSRQLRDKFGTKPGQLFDTNVTAVGSLVALWSLADTHADEDGLLYGYTAEDVNRAIGIDNFVEMLPDDWIDLSGPFVQLPEYQVHNGENAKKRAQDQKRKAISRAKGKSGQKADKPPTETGQNSDKSVTREEKRREEESKEETTEKKQPCPPSGSVPKYSEQFERFWTAWGSHHRRTSKGPCYKVWKKSKLDAKIDHVVAVVNALNKSKSWTEEIAKFKPAPLAWLNQEKWDCEVGDIEACPEKKPAAPTGPYKKADWRY